MRLPHNATTFIGVEGIIQCFEMERLSVESLWEGFEHGQVSRSGKLPVKYLYKIKETVSRSGLLSQKDIDDALAMLPSPARDYTERLK